jgi:hypothetical protein
VGKRLKRQVELVDLQEILARSIPAAQTIVCKFVIVACGNELILIFGPVRMYRYHANLVDAYCSNRDIPSGWLKKPDIVEVYDDNYVIQGGGWMDIEPGSNYMKVYGNSTAYGQFDPSDLNSIVDGSPALTGFTVEVGD